jgi:hypothetical protein
VNNTVVGFETGVSVEGTNRENWPSFHLALENMLLVNDNDVVGLLSGEVSHSLISTGQFAGQNGNFGGLPLLGPLQQLLFGSIGIDAGDNSAAFGLTADIAGRPRILDGNDDGIPIVDVGAYEVVPEPASAGLLLIGAILSSAVPRHSRRPRIPARK